MKRFTFPLLALLAFFSLPARAAYTSAAVQGDYTYLLDAWTVSPGTNAATAGLLVFDGSRGVSGSVFQLTSTSQQQFPIETGSVYSVEPDGFGSMTLHTSGGMFQFAFVLTSVSSGVAQGLQLLLLKPSNSEVVTTGTAFAINLSALGNNTYLKGTYSFILNNWQADPSAPILGAVGELKFDGAGGVTLYSRFELRGVEQVQTSVGTYSVTTDGAGSMSFGPATYYFGVNALRGSIATGFWFIGNPNGVETATAILQ